MILIQCTLNRTQNRKGAYTEDKAAGYYSLPQLAVTLPGGYAVNPFLEPQDSSQGSPQSQTHDEENGVLRIRHVLHNGVYSKSKGSHAHCDKESVIDTLTHHPLEQSSHQAACYYCTYIYKCSYHYFLIMLNLLNATHPANTSPMYPRTV